MVRFSHVEGMIVKRYALAATLSLVSVCLGGAVQAAAIDLSQPVQAARTGTPPALVSMSELPEPEVFVMMLVGLILIGYRARRDSSDTFE